MHNEELIFLLITKQRSVNEIGEKRMGQSCGMYGGVEKCRQAFGSLSLKHREL